MTCVCVQLLVAAAGACARVRSKRARVHDVRAHVGATATGVGEQPMTSMTTRSQTAVRRAEGRCATPDCPFYRVHRDVCSGCAGRLVASAERTVATIVRPALALQRIGLASDGTAEVFGSRIRAGLPAPYVMRRLIATFAELHAMHGPRLFSTAQTRRLFERVRDAGVHAANEYPERSSLHGVLLSFCATPWELARDMDELVSRTAMCYWGNMGEPPTSVAAYEQLLANHRRSMRGLGSSGAPLPC